MWIRCIFLCFSLFLALSNRANGICIEKPQNVAHKTFTSCGPESYFLFLFLFFNDLSNIIAADLPAELQHGVNANSKCPSVSYTCNMLQDIHFCMQPSRRSGGPIKLCFGERVCSQGFSYIYARTATKEAHTNLCISKPDSTLIKRLWQRPSCYHSFA